MNLNKKNNFAFGKKTIFISILIGLGLLSTGCQSNKNIHITRTGVITKIDNNVMDITLNTGMNIKLVAITGKEEVGDTIKLEVK